MNEEKLVPKLRFVGFDENWDETKFKDICSINQGLQIAISERFTEDAPNRYFYITNEFLKENSDKKYYIENPPKSVICDKDDILMTRTGNTGKVLTDIEGVFHNNFFKINYNDKIEKYFLFYVLNSNTIQNKIMRLAGTSTIPDLKHDDFYNIKFNLPSFREQEKISKFILIVDKKIGLLKEKYESYVDFKKYMMQQIFAQKLRFNENCNEIKLKNIVDYQNSKALEKYFNDSNGYEVISIGNYTNDGRYIKNNVFISKDVLEVHKYILNKNDLAMVLNDKTKEGNIIGRCILIDENNKYVYNQRTARLIPKNDINPYYLHQLINSPLIHNKIIALSQGATQIYINKNDLLNIKLPIPNIEIQNEIGNLFGNVNKKIDLSSLKLKQMNLFKKGLLQQMFV